MFAPENWVIGDGVPPDKECKLFIDVLEDPVIIPIDKKNNVLFDSKKLIKRVEVLQTRVIMLMSASAIERYEHFIETYPDLIQRVSQKMIASYIGITPEALSNVRSEFFPRYINDNYCIDCNMYKFLCIL